MSVKSEIKIDNTNKKSLKVNKNIYEVVDVCTIIEKCSIEEISKYLIDQGNERDYPDITIINDSDNIREIYKSKLNHMTINKNNYIIYK